MITVTAAAKENISQLICFCYVNFCLYTLQFWFYLEGTEESLETESLQEIYFDTR